LFFFKFQGRSEQSLNCEKLAEGEVKLFDGRSPTKIVMYVVYS